MLKNILLVAFFLVQSILFAQHAQTKRLFDMLDILYQKEEYKAGLNRIRDLKNKIIKQEGDSSIYTTHIDAWSALLKGNIDDYDDYNNLLKISLKKLKTFSTNTPGYTETVLTVCKALKIKSDLITAKKLLESLPTKSDQITYETHLLNYELGYLSSITAELEQEITTTTGKQKALRILLLGKIYNDQQNYKASQLLISHQDWIKTTFKSKYGYKAQLLFELGRAENNKGNYKSAENLYAKALAIGGKSCPPHSRVLDEIQSYRYENLLLQKLNSEADYHKNLQDVKTLSYFGKKSAAYLAHQLTAIKVTYDYGKPMLALKQLEKYTNDLSYYPLEHRNRLIVAQIALPIYLATNQLNTADSLLNNTIQFVKTKHDTSSPKYHQWILEKASYISLYTNNIKKSIPLFETSLPVLKKEFSSSHPLYIQYFQNYITALTNLEQFKKAKTALEKTQPNEFIIPKATIQLILGNPEVTENLITNYVDSLKNIPGVITKVTRAEAYRVLAASYQFKGDYSKADSIFNTADKLIIHQFYHQKFSALEEKHELIVASSKINKYKRELINDLANKTVHDNHYSLLSSLNLLTELHILTGDYNEAEKLISKAQNIIMEVYSDSSLQYAKLLTTKKLLYEALGDYKNAEISAALIVKITEHTFGKGHLHTAIPLGEWALAKSYNNNNDTSNFTAINSSLAIIRNELGENQIMYANALEIAGMYYIISGNFNAAKQYITDAKSIWLENVSQNENIAKLEYLLGSINLELEAYKESLSNFTASQNTYQNLFNDNHPNYIDAQGMIARVYYTLGKKKEAINTANDVVDKSLNYLQTIFPNLSEREKTNYWYKVKDHFEFYNTLAFTSANVYPNMIGKVFDINLQTKAILLNASIKLKNEILNSNDPELLEKYNEWLELKELLTQAISKNADERKAKNIDLNKLGNKIETIEKYLGQQTVCFSKNNNNKQYKWQTLKDIVNKEDHIIETIAFRVFDKRFTDSIWYAALEVNADTKNNPSYAVFKNGNFMHTKGIAYYRQCIKYGLEDTKSFHSFWKPIDSLITKKGSVYISYEGIYNRLNPETFIAPDDEYLINKYNIIPIGTARDLIDNQIPENTSLSKTAEFIGNPNFYSHTYTKPKRWSQLPGTEKEVTFLHKYLTEQNWSSTITKEEAATEKYLKSISNPDIFHIATHGFYIEKATSSSNDQLAGKTVNNPLLRSGIMLQHGGEIYDNSSVHEFNKEDGILTAHEAMGLQLDKTSLVVLSACETGLGEIELGEGVFGLQRSFTVAGAKTIIISLFKVSDEVTTELMKRFYEEWIATNNKQQAFITAKKEIMKTYKEPSLWGAFLMISSSLSN